MEKFKKFWGNFYALFLQIDESNDQTLSIVEVSTFLDAESTKRSLKKSPEEVTLFVNNLFFDFAVNDKLTVIEFICALPELMDSLEDVSVPATDEDQSSPDEVREQVREKLAKKLSKNFNEIDVHNSGSVSIDEMW